MTDHNPRPKKARRLEKQRQPAIQRDAAADKLLRSLEYRQAESEAVVDSLAWGEACAPAWSCTNLLAFPLTTGSSSSSSPSAPAVALTHFTGTSEPRVSFSLQLPLPAGVSPRSRVSKLSYSPDGGYLLVVTTSTLNRGIDDDDDDDEDCLTLFEEKNGCLNEWEVVYTESISAFVSASEGGRRVVDVRWINEPRRWYPSPPGSTVPLFRAPARSPTLTGSAVVLVLSSPEALFMHFPRTLPLVPSVTLVSLTALSNTISTPKPSTSSPSQSSQPKMDVLVANLVDSLPPAVGQAGTDAGALGLLTVGGQADGVKAMKDELKAAEKQNSTEKKGASPKKLVKKAAVGIARGAGPLSTTLIVATHSVPIGYRRSSPTVATKTGASSDHQGDAKLSNELSAAGSPADFGSGMDFSALDEAFGEKTLDVPMPSNVKGKEKKVRVQESLENCRKIELIEVVITFESRDTFRTAVTPLSPLYLEDPIDSTSKVCGVLTHLEFLQDLTGNGNGGSEDAVDLRLLAVTATSKSEREVGPVSVMRSWALSNEPFPLVEAFGHLENRKKDVAVGPKTWGTRKVAMVQLHGFITAISTIASPTLASFAAIRAAITHDDTQSEVVVFDAIKLEQKPDAGAAALPSPSLFSSIAISPNFGIVCAMPQELSFSQPSVTLAPISANEEGMSDTLATRLALALVQEVDSSDLVAVVASEKTDPSVIDVVRKCRDLLQRMLRDGSLVSDTAFQLELVAFSSSAYSSRSHKLVRQSTVARKITELAACVRAFDSCETKDRSMPLSGYRCESDAVWPLIGHATWFMDFCEELLRDCSMNVIQTSEPNPMQVLLMHPLPRGCMIRIAECILGLQAFLTSFLPGSNTMVDISKSVVDDLVGFSRLVLREWHTVLVQIGALAGLSGDSDELRQMLVDFSVPKEFVTASAIVTALISTPAIFPASSAALSLSPNLKPSKLDIVRRSVLPLDEDDDSIVTNANVGFSTNNNTDSDTLLALANTNKTSNIKLRSCSRCGSKSERRAFSATEAGRWIGFEMQWDSRCLCGGQWIVAGPFQRD